MLMVLRSWRFQFVIVLLSGLALFPHYANASCVIEEQKPVTSLSRQIVSSDGKPVADADISVRDDRDNMLSETTSDSRGVYRVPALKPGQYRIWIRARGYMRYSYTLVISRGASETKLSQVRMMAISECHDINGP